MAKQNDAVLGEREQQPRLAFVLHPHESEKKCDERPTGESAQILKTSDGESNMEFSIGTKRRAEVLDYGNFFHGPDPLKSLGRLD